MCRNGAARRFKQRMTPTSLRVDNALRAVLGARFFALRSARVAGCIGACKSTHARRCAGIINER